MSVSPTCVNVFFVRRNNTYLMGVISCLFPSYGELPGQAIAGLVDMELEAISPTALELAGLSEWYIRTIKGQEPARERQAGMVNLRVNKNVEAENPASALAHKPIEIKAVEALARGRRDGRRVAIERRQQRDDFIRGQLAPIEESDFQG